MDRDERTRKEWQKAIILTFDTSADQRQHRIICIDIWIFWCVSYVSFPFQFKEGAYNFTSYQLFKEEYIFEQTFSALFRHFSD